jgi:RimJ/RimL family protein N-acetyltransferase
LEVDAAHPKTGGFSGWLRRLRERVAGKYSIYVIYQSPPASTGIDERPEGMEIIRATAEELSRSETVLIRELSWYGGAGSDLFVCRSNGKIIGMCSFWHGERYRSRNFWPLQEGEAKLVQVIVEPSARGKGVATALIRQGTNAMLAQGFRRCYARVWWRNVPSRRAFLHAGWVKIATVIEGEPLGYLRKRRLVLR